MQETIEEEMRGGSFDSPTTDPPSSQLGIPADQLAVRCLPSDEDADTVSSRRRETASVLGCRSSSPSRRRTLSVAYLRPLSNVTDSQLNDRCATRSLPNVRLIRDATSAQRGCDATGSRTDSAHDDENWPDLSVDPDASSTADGRHIVDVRGRNVERPQRVSRSDSDMLKMPPSSSTSNCHEHRGTSRPSSLDRSRRSANEVHHRHATVASECDLSNR